MNVPKRKYDQDYQKVLKFLSVQYGWIHLEVLPPLFHDLINDVIVSTKKVRKLL